MSRSSPPRPRPRAPRRSPPRRRLPTLLGLFLAALLVGALVGAREPAPRVSSQLPPDGARLGAPALAALEFHWQVEPASALARASVWLDGALVDGARVDGGTLRYRPADLSDGEHEIELRVERGFPFPDVRHRRSFLVDTAPPSLDVTAPEAPVRPAQPVVLVGEVGGEATLTADGRPVPVAGGRFELTLPEPPAGPVVLEASDELGNVAREAVEVEVAAPSPRVDEVRAVHVSAYAWATPSLREPVLQMVDDGLITAVELDLKDESGMVGYDTEVALAHELGAAGAVYDLTEALETLHARGVHVIGRIVAFRDPLLVDWAWDHGHRDWAVQNADGSRYAQYGGYANFAHPQVRRYNLDIAVEAARAGVDDILWDYIRRPDGPLERMEFPGLEHTPEESIVGFVADSRTELLPLGTVHGVSVFGVAATRPGEIAQDVPALAEHVDYVAPMLYPSHWGPGEYGVADPHRQPYEIVRRSMLDFLEAVSASEGTRVVPWLQDFSLGVRYGPQEVRAQIDATRDSGVHEWILWDPNVRYQRAALEPG